MARTNKAGGNPIEEEGRAACRAGIPKAQAPYRNSTGRGYRHTWERGWQREWIKMQKEKRHG